MCSKLTIKAAKGEVIDVVLVTLLLTLIALTFSNPSIVVFEQGNIFWITRVSTVSKVNSL